MVHITFKISSLSVQWNIHFPLGISQEKETLTPKPCDKNLPKAEAMVPIWKVGIEYYIWSASKTFKNIKLFLPKGLGPKESF